MPTFQSVNLDPTVSGLFTGTATTRPTTTNDNDEALVLEAGGTAAAAAAAAAEDDSNKVHDHSQEMIVVVGHVGQIAGISTPRSMITRAPQDLVEVFLRNKQKLYPNNNSSSSGSNKTPLRKRGRHDSTSPSSSSPRDDNNDDDENQQNQQPQQQPQQPQQRLRSDLLDEMEGLRKQVAHKMIGRTRTGKLFLAKSLSQPQQQNFSEKKISSSTGHSNVLVPGASFTPLDLWEMQSRQTLDNKNNNTMSNITDRVISTGCEALDRLLTFPPEALDFTRLEPQHHCSSRQLGLPPGYVLQITSSGSSLPSQTTGGGGDGRTISATKGKTQLALQIAARAVKDSIRTSKIPRQETEHQYENEYPVLAATSRRLVKVRYCYSAGGHAGHSLATRFLDLLGGEKYRQQRRRSSSSSKKSRDIIPPQGGDQIEFQPIHQLSQLSATLATIEHEWVQTLLPPGSRNNTDLSSMTINENPPSILVVDGLYSIPPEQNETQFFKIERWLKRIARQYSISVIVVGGGGGGGGATGNNNMADRMDGTKTSDCHLNLTVDNESSTSSSSTKVQLMRHPFKLVTDKDSVIIEHDSTTGMLLSSSHDTES